MNECNGGLPVTWQKLNHSCSVGRFVGVLKDRDAVEEARDDEAHNSKGNELVAESSLLILNLLLLGLLLHLVLGCL